MALWEKDADVEPGGGYEDAEWDAPGWGDCCRDWKPLRMWFSDWAAGRFPGLSFRDEDGPALQQMSVSVMKKSGVRVSVSDRP